MIVFDGATTGVEHLAFGPGGRLLAASGPGRPFEMWDVTAANRWGRYTGVAFVSGRAAFHPTKPVCVVPVHVGVCVIDTDTKKAEVVWNSDKGHEYVANPEFAPDGETFVSARADGVRCLRRRAGGVHQFLWAGKHPALAFRARRAFPLPGLAVGFAPSGRVLVVLDGYRLYNEPAPRIVRVRTIRAKDGKQLAAAAVPPGTRPPLAFAPDGKHFGTLEPGKFVLRDLKALEPIAEVKCGRARPSAAAFHPGGKWLAVAAGTAVKLFDTGSWKVARELDWKIGRVACVAFSPDGALAAAGGDSGKIVVWDADA